MTHSIAARLPSTRIAEAQERVESARAVDHAVIDIDGAARLPRATRVPPGAAAAHGADRSSRVEVTDRRRPLTDPRDA